MAKAKFTTAASAGVMPFNLADLTELWANLRDGNYWSAFRKAIRLLDNMVNAEEGRVMVHPWTEDDGEKIDDCCREMEKWRDDYSRTIAHKVVKVVPEMGEPNVDAVPIGEIIGLITLVLQMIQAWRKRKDQPTPPAGVSGTTTGLPAVPGQPGTVPRVAATRAPVFPPHVQVTDKPAAHPSTADREGNKPINPPEEPTGESQQPTPAGSIFDGEKPTPEAGGEDVDTEPETLPQPSTPHATPPAEKLVPSTGGKTPTVPPNPPASPPSPPVHPQANPPVHPTPKPKFPPPKK